MEKKLEELKKEVKGLKEEVREFKEWSGRESEETEKMEAQNLLDLIADVMNS